MRANPQLTNPNRDRQEAALDSHPKRPASAHPKRRPRGSSQHVHPSAPPRIANRKSQIANRKSQGATSPLHLTASPPQPPPMPRRTTPSPHPGPENRTHANARAFPSVPHAFESVPKQEKVSPGTHARRHCRGITRAGVPCRFPPLKGASYCINHDPSADPREAAVRAGLASGRARRSPAEHLLDAAFSLSDRAGVQALIDATLRLAIARRIPTTTVEQVFRGCALAIRNFDAATETLTGPGPQAHDLPQHFALVQGFLASVQPILLEADAADQAMQEAFREALR